MYEIFIHRDSIEKSSPAPSKFSTKNPKIDHNEITVVYQNKYNDFLTFEAIITTELIFRLLYLPSHKIFFINFKCTKICSAPNIAVLNMEGNQVL